MSEVDCPHCPDGHTPFDRGSHPWNCFVSSDRDSDGQPTHLVVMRSAGEHCAQSDADALYELMKNPVNGETSDGFHTFNELYRHRMLLTATLFREWLSVDDYPGGPGPEYGYQPHKSWNHSDGQTCGEAFGAAPGSWFIVVAQLPTGQISYHYQAQHWDLFKIPERDLPAEFDGHTAEQAADRLESFLFDL